MRTVRVHFVDVRPKRYGIQDLYRVPHPASYTQEVILGSLKHCKKKGGTRVRDDREAGRQSIMLGGMFMDSESKTE
jgi:hypothetical protein